MISDTQLSKSNKCLIILNTLPRGTLHNFPYIFFNLPHKFESDLFPPEASGNSYWSSHAAISFLICSLLNSRLSRHL